MSTNISNHDLLLFIQRKVGSELSAGEAKELKIENEYNDAVLEIGDDAISADDIPDIDDLYAKFATMYVEEQEQNNTENEESKKEKERKVQSKNSNAKA